jgi:hypothetical protein
MRQPVRMRQQRALRCTRALRLCSNTLPCSSLPIDY